MGEWSLHRKCKGNWNELKMVFFCFFIPIDGAFAKWVSRWKRRQQHRGPESECRFEVGWEAWKDAKEENLSRHWPISWRCTRSLAPRSKNLQRALLTMPPHTSRTSRSAAGQTFISTNWTLSTPSSMQLMHQGRSLVRAPIALLNPRPRGYGKLYRAFRA